MDTLYKWAQTKLAPWQQDALRLLAAGGSLNAAQRAEVLAALKSACGVPGAAVVSPRALTAQDLVGGARSPAVERVLLGAVGPVSHVNRLAPNNVLKFATNGITLIYGENGSGKSGYCRIVKKLCSARSVEDLLPNVLSSGTLGTPQAAVKYHIEGEPNPRAEQWTVDQPAPLALSRISVFDTRNGRLYVDDKNEVEYLPTEIELLTRLGQLMAELALEVDNEIREVDGRLKVTVPLAFQTDTPAGKLVAQLSVGMQALPSEAALRAGAVWTPELDVELATLTRELSIDPEAATKAIGRQHTALKTLQADCVLIEEQLGDDTRIKFVAALDTATTTAQAAKLSAAASFGEEPLQQAGSAAAWKQMFKFAKEYSLVVYPDADPPARRDGDRCVLCQQVLQPEARARFDRFERYVQDRSAAEAQAAQTTLDAHRATLKSLTLRTAPDAQQLLKEYTQTGAAAEGLTQSIVAFLTTAETRRMALVHLQTGTNTEALPALAPSLREIFTAELARLETDRLARTETPEGLRLREQRQTRRRNLDDQKKLSGELNRVLSRLADLTLRARLGICKDKLGDTTIVSRQVTKRRGELVTKELAESLTRELKALDLEYLPFKVEEESKKATSLVRVALKSLRPVQNANVLSEGEQRALALACFLADVGRVKGNHGVVIDDPVSSLDNVRIRRVAQRLAEEAATGRQVIVFTHSLVFYHEVLAAAAALAVGPVPVHNVWIRKTDSDGFGIIADNEEPWIAKGATSRLPVLQQGLGKAKSHADSSSDEYRRVVKDFYSDLRESWERLVEEGLLGKVVERFGSDVKTQSLKQVEVTDEDYRRVFWSMKQVSERSGHDMSSARAVPVPTWQDMKAHLDDFESFAKSLKSRQKTVGERRRLLEDPPQAATM